MPPTAPSGSAWRRTPSSDGPPLWRHWGFQVLWLSTAACGFGDRLIELAALPMLGVADESAQAAAITSAIYFWYFLPWLLLTPVSGWLADTLPRKWVLFFCDQGRAALMLLAMLLVPAGMTAAAFSATDGQPVANWKVYGILLGVGALAATFSPTRNAMIPQVIPPKQLNGANSVILSIGVVASLIGYIFGGKLLNDVSIHAGLWVACFCFSAGGFFFVFIKPRHRQSLDTDKHLSEWVRLTRAWSYIKTHRPVFRLILLNALLWTMAMIVAPAIAALCKHQYDLPADRFMADFAMLNAALGVGMLSGAALVALLNVRRESDFFTLSAIALTAISLVLLAVNRSFALALPLAFLVGVTGGMVMIQVLALTQTVVPNFILGRVGGVREVLSNVSSVSINLIVWQLPFLHELYPSLPNADSLLIGSLYPLGFGLMGLAIVGLATRLPAGPLDHPMANVLWRLDRFYTQIWHRLSWSGRQNIPRLGPVILAANHTAGLDPLLIQAACPRRVTWLMLKNYRFPIFAFVWRAMKPIAIDEHQSNFRQIRMVLAELTSSPDAVVGIFPEGGIQHGPDKGKELLPFEPGVALLARLSGATIVPVWIQGTPKPRRMLWHFLLPSRSSVRFGSPLKPSPDQDDSTILAELRQRMRELRS